MQPKRMKRSFSYSLINPKYEHKSLKILIAGAGGIGCELIKNLFKIKQFIITIIDYDTISQSNLNRQFCYRKQDINKHKVDVLYTYFKKINPNFIITTQKNNIFDYDSLYFSQFDILISALDNNQARKYLNCMAIDNNIPMIDAGTSGFNGQATFYIRYVTECRMCRDQPQLQPQSQTSYAVCTLRGKPERNIHCIQFSINLYKQILLICSKINSDNNNNKRQQIHGYQQQSQWLGIRKYIQKFMACRNQQQAYTICIQIHNQIFYNNIQITNIQGIIPIKYNTQQYHHHQQQLLSLQKQPKSKQKQNIVDIMQNPQHEQKLYAKQMPPPFYSFLFVSVLDFLLTSTRQVSQYSQPYREFDKDDFLPTLFVYAVTNIRIANFKNIPYSKLKHISYYECKDQSGRIIPAIASTNSIAAALQILLLHRLQTIDIPHNINRQQIASLYRQSTSTSAAYMSIKGYISDHKIEQYITHKPRIGCSYCSPLYNCVHVYADYGNVTWGQLQTYLSQNFDQSLTGRDIRCGQFILVRNSIPNPWHTNKPKPLNFNPKLIQHSKLGYNYLSVTYIASQAYPASWKFLIIMKQNIQRIQMGHAMTKLTRQQYRDCADRQVERLGKMRLVSLQQSMSMLNPDDIVIYQQ